MLTDHDGTLNKGTSIHAFEEGGHPPLVMVVPANNTISPSGLPSLAQQGQARVEPRPPLPCPPFSFRDPRRKQRFVQCSLDPPLQRVERQRPARMIEQQEPVSDQGHRYRHSYPPRTVTDQGVQLQHPLQPPKHDLNRPPVRPQLRNPLRRLLQQAGHDRPSLPLGIRRIQNTPMARSVRARLAMLGSVHWTKTRCTA